MTAVEWLDRWFRDNPEATHEEGNKALQQAKEMEKQQMEESFTEGYKSGIVDHIDMQNGYDGRAIGFSQYYNEKYGNELVQKMQQFGKPEQLKKD